MSDSQSKIFLLTGRTGNGKSSTGNFFLSGLYFLPHSSLSDDTRILRYSATVTGRAITVIDGTGIGDIGEDLACSAEDLLENTREALQDGGFDVLVFVLKYGVRFTKQEKDAVQRVKDMFGEDVFKTRGVIVMTYGDNFQLDNEDENVEFVDWCRRQTGEVENLFEEVQYRIVLVNNKTKDKTATREEFFALTDKLNISTYTITDFDKNKTKHDFIVVNENRPKHIKVVKDFIATVHAQIKKNYFTYASDRKMLVSELETCKKQLEEKLELIRYEDKGTKILRDLEDSLSLEVLTLNSKLNGLRININPVDEDRDADLKGNGGPKKPKKDVWVVCKTIGILLGGGFVVYFSCSILYRLYRHRFTDPAAPNTIWTYGRFSLSRSLGGKMTSLLSWK
ncbi:uncharacterized protein LOC131938159 [Physella acuta]|uniref:uncharacterized protein LOC131938159 n=1 Tax=Physella acuta TaxID=109671 RepID=UPI0027DABE4C|nr:uncharacterized protein LOC131938159 [Physella acuta]